MISRYVYVLWYLKKYRLPQIRRIYQKILWNQFIYSFMILIPMLLIKLMKYYYVTVRRQFTEWGRSDATAYWPHYTSTDYIEVNMPLVNKQLSHLLYFSAFGLSLSKASDQCVTQNSAIIIIMLFPDWETFLVDYYTSFIHV